MIINCKEIREKEIENKFLENSKSEIDSILGDINNLLASI